MIEKKSEPQTSGLGVEGLQAYLTQHVIAGEIHILEAATPTVEAAAQALGCETGQIVKSILFLVNGAPKMAVTCGTSRVDPRTLARHFEIGRKKVKLARAEVVLALTGYLVGGVPPFGYPEPLPTFLDPSVLAHETVWAGGGTKNAMLNIDSQLILKTTNATTLDLHTLPA